MLILLVNAAGCDSLITITLTVNNSSSASISPIACDSYTAPSGAVYTMSGTYADTLVNAAGCDSLITITLTINNSSAASISPSACDSYTAPSGAVYTMSGTYTDTILTMAGCDSVLTILLTIDSLDTTLTPSGVTLTANQSGAIYQWVNCDSGSAPIPGETSQSFTATTSGNYAVNLTLGACTQTSACENVTLVTLDFSHGRSVQFSIVSQILLIIN